MHNAGEHRSLGRRLRLYLTVAVFLSPAVLGLAIFQYGPLIVALRNSFRELNLLNIDASSFVGLENYNRLLGDAIFWTSFRNTFVFTAGKIALQIPLALALALLVQKEARGIGIVRSSIFAPVVTATAVVAIVWNLMYHPTGGLMNSVLQWVGISRQPFLTSAEQALPAILLMSIWQDVGFTMLIFLAGLQGIPQDFLDSAAIDGAGKSDILRHVILPLLKRVILFAVVVTTITSFTTFTPIYIMTKGGPQKATLMAVYHIFQQAFQFMRMGYASALAVVLVLVMLVIAWLQSRLLRTEFEY